MTPLTSRPAQAPRGMTLIESMVAMGIFLAGMLGIFQGALTASRQNSMANKVTLATGIAQQARTAIAIRGLDRLSTTLLNGTCVSGASAATLAGGLETATGACVLDLDAFETGTDPLMPGYSALSTRNFRRAVVRLSATNAAKVNLAVVVSFQDVGRRTYAKQFVTLFNATTISAGTEL